MHTYPKILIPSAVMLWISSHAIALYMGTIFCSRADPPATPCEGHQAARVFYVSGVRCHRCVLSAVCSRMCVPSAVCCNYVYSLLSAVSCMTVCIGPQDRVVSLNFQAYQDPGPPETYEKPKENTSLCSRPFKTLGKSIYSALTL